MSAPFRFILMPRRKYFAPSKGRKKATTRCKRSVKTRKCAWPFSKESPWRGRQRARSSTIQKCWEGSWRWQGFIARNFAGVLSRVRSWQKYALITHARRAKVGVLGINGNMLNFWRGFKLVFRLRKNESSSNNCWRGWWLHWCWGQTTCFGITCSRWSCLSKRFENRLSQARTWTWRGQGLVKVYVAVL